MKHLLWGILLSILAAACGGSLREGGSAGGGVEYSVSARQNYEKGIRHLEDEKWLEAAKYISFVKARFPYSKYAVLAELRLADAAFGTGAYLTAIDQYKLFIKFHPTHDMVTNGYANFRIGAAYYEMLPSDWFLTPPRYEKDMSVVIDCVRELDSYKQKYPQSPYMKEAMRMRAEAARILAAHEWYVAEFYRKRDQPMGTVLRLRTLLDRYPGSGFDRQALSLLGKAYIEVGRPEDARKAFQRLVTEHPKSSEAAEARRFLGRLGG